MKAKQKEQECVNHLMMHQLTLKNLLLAAKTLATARKAGSTSLNTPLEDVIRELLAETLEVLRSNRFKPGAGDTAGCDQGCRGGAYDLSSDEEEDSEEEEEEEEDSSSDSNSARVMPFAIPNARKVMWGLVPVLLLIVLIVQCSS